MAEEVQRAFTESNSTMIGLTCLRSRGVPELGDVADGTGLVLPAAQIAAVLHRERCSTFDIIMMPPTTTTAVG